MRVQTPTTGGFQRADRLLHDHHQRIYSPILSPEIRERGLVACPLETGKRSGKHRSWKGRRATDLQSVHVHQSHGPRRGGRGWFCQESPFSGRRDGLDGTIGLNEFGEGIVGFETIIVPVEAFNNKSCFLIVPALLVHNIARIWGSWRKWKPTCLSNLPACLDNSFEGSDEILIVCHDGILNEQTHCQWKWLF